jgi:putative FmdB family regulatory protein
MPLYEYECASCVSIQEVVKTIANRNDNPDCPQCGNQTGRIICSNIRREFPTWLDSATDNLHAEAKHMVTDRTSFYKYLKKNDLEQTG